MRIIIALLFCLSNPLMAAPSTESTAQLTDAQRQSADNYDLKTMDVIPLTGIPLRLAAYAMTGTNFIKRTIRSLVAKKTFNDIGVPALKTFADTLEGRLKWPFYRLSKQASPSDAVGQDPSKVNLLPKAGRCGTVAVKRIVIREKTSLDPGPDPTTPSRTTIM
ncbi:hypothetical protein FOZ63_033619, partial [Perkinsus olseni]